MTAYFAPSNNIKCIATFINIIITHEKYLNKYINEYSGYTLCSFSI